MMFSISHDVAACDVAAYLRGGDLSALQCVDVMTNEFVAESGMWQTIIKKEVPQLVVDGDMLKDRALRPLVLECLGFLSRAILSQNCVVKVSNAAELQQLRAKLSNAARTRTVHVQSGGRVAHVLVGDFGFNFDDPSSTFLFKQDQSLLLGGFRAGQLQVKICIDKGRVMLGATYHERRKRRRDSDRTSTVALAANVSSVNSSALLSVRGAPICLDGVSRTTPTGTCSGALGHVSQGPSVLSSLCVVTLMDGNPTLGERALVNALSIDAFTSRVPRAS